MPPKAQNSLSDDDIKSTILNSINAHNWTSPLIVDKQTVRWDRLWTEVIRELNQPLYKYRKTSENMPDYTDKTGNIMSGRKIITVNKIEGDFQMGLMQRNFGDAAEKNLSLNRDMDRGRGRDFDIRNQGQLRTRQSSQTNDHGDTAEANPSRDRGLGIRNHGDATEANSVGTAETDWNLDRRLKEEHNRAEAKRVAFEEAIDELRITYNNPPHISQLNNLNYFQLNAYIEAKETFDEFEFLSLTITPSDEHNKYNIIIRKIDLTKEIIRDKLRTFADSRNSELNYIGLLTLDESEMYKEVIGEDEFKKYGMSCEKEILTHTRRNMKLNTTETIPTGKVNLKIKKTMSNVDLGIPFYNISPEKIVIPTHQVTPTQQQGIFERTSKKPPQRPNNNVAVAESLIREFLDSGVDVKEFEKIPNFIRRELKKLIESNEGQPGIYSSILGIETIESTKTAGAQNTATIILKKKQQGQQGGLINKYLYKINKYEHKIKMSKY
jgi:hypothetical protein